MTEVFVGRQPIFDRRLKVFGYELLFRSHAQKGLKSAPKNGQPNFGKGNIEPLLDTTHIKVPSGYVQGGFYI